MPQIISKFSFNKNNVIDSHDDVHDNNIKLQYNSVDSKQPVFEGKMNFYNQLKSPAFDPMANSEIEQRITETLIRLLKQLPTDSLGNVQSQHLSKILINDHDEESHPKLVNITSDQKLSYSSDDDAFMPKEQAFSQYDNIGSYSASQERDSANYQVNLVPKNVSFPKQSRKTKRRKSPKKNTKKTRRKSPKSSKSKSQSKLKKSASKAVYSQKLIKEENHTENTSVETKSKFILTLHYFVDFNPDFIRRN